MIRLSDEQWKRIREHFPEEHIADGRPGRKSIPARDVLEATLWILNTGAQWHMLPQCYPNYKTVHRRFQARCHNEVLRRVLTDVANELRERGVLDEEECFIDATFAMAKGGGAHGPTTRSSNLRSDGRSVLSSALHFTFLNLGQRRSDVVRMAQTHITPERKIRIKQQKTGRELLIPLHRDTVEALDAYSIQHIVIITTAYGKPFTVDGFSGWMRDAISEAGLPLDCKPHGLRKAAGRLLAEAGATSKMIMAILGHTTLAEAERYCEEAEQAGLAVAAVIKLEAHKTNKHSQTTSGSLGKSAKKREKSE
jgi:integrase